MSTVRLALTTCIGEGGAMSSTNLSRAFPEPDCMPAVRLAYNPGPCQTYKPFSVNQNTPALLVSYVYLDGFLKHREKYCFRDWVLDSGAFSAHNSGTAISLQSYIDTAKRLLETDGKLTEVFALDVIGNGKASLRNCEEMWRQGIPAIPTYHRGSPETELKYLAENYPKIALGGVAMLRGDAKMKWAGQCFARVWPKKIHGFGFGTESQVLGLPWHSVDATNWEIGPCAFGQWKKFGKMSVRGSNQNLRSQVEHYLEMEKKARVRWKKEMAQLEAMDAHVVRLASGLSLTLESGKQRVASAFGNNLHRDEAKRAALTPPPEVRLAYHPEGGRTLTPPPSVKLATHWNSQGSNFLTRQST